MALPKLMRDIFANEGAGPLFRKDRIPAIGVADVPSIFVKVAAQTFSDAQKKQARANIGADAIPSGTMMAYGGKSIPDGWLLCNGATVRRTTYAKLFAAIGTAWGAGDGSTTFKLPDADGRVMQGVTDASKVGQYLEAGLPNIIGSISVPRRLNAPISGAFNGAVDGSGIGAGVSSSGEVKFDSTISFNAAYGGGWGIYGSSNTVQPSAVQILIIIKI